MMENEVRKGDKIEVFTGLGVVGVGIAGSDIRHIEGVHVIGFIFLDGVRSYVVPATQIRKRDHAIISK